jgi:uroporphyrinogen decarboxylase
MTPRERYIATLTFGKPDKIPFNPGGPRESTLAAWRTQGLGAEGHWFNHLLKALRIKPEPARPLRRLGVDFRMIPQFEERVLEHRDGHYVVQDWKGNICEIADRYDATYLREAKDFVTRRWIRCPVETADDWQSMKRRYRVDSPGRFPEDFAERCRLAADRDQVLSLVFPGPFWQLREWCGFEGLCLLTVEQPDLVDEMAAFWTDFIARVLERILQRIAPDHVCINEDMAYKEHAMISPAMTRRFCQPSWNRWVGLCKAAGVPVIEVDSDGFVGELVPLWIASGVNVCSPMEVAAGNDLNEFRRRHGRSIAYCGGVDKRAMAAGGQVIREEMDRLGPVIRDGGYIPSCDHGVPADVSWPNFLDYARLLAQMTGWV